MIKDFAKFGSLSIVTKYSDSWNQQLQYGNIYIFAHGHSYSGDKMTLSFKCEKITAHNTAVLHKNLMKNL